MENEPTNIEDPAVQKALAQTAIKITEEDKENFYKSFISDNPFVEDSKLFGDRLKVTFKTLSINEHSQVFQQIKLDKQNGQADLDDDYMIRISMYRLGLALLKINDEPFHPDIDDEKILLAEKKELTLVKARADLFQNWPTYKLHGVLEAFRHFENKVLKLSNEMSDPNFWKAAK